MRTSPFANEIAGLTSKGISFSGLSRIACIGFDSSWYCESQALSVRVSFRRRSRSLRVKRSGQAHPA
jgi:hypothetical protein